MMEIRPPAHLIEKDIENKARGKRRSFTNSFPLYYWLILLLVIVILLMVVNGLINVPPH